MSASDAAPTSAPIVAPDVAHDDVPSSTLVGQSGDTSGDVRTLGERVAMNLGLVAFSRLTGFARHLTLDYKRRCPGMRVFLFGSALDRKDWRDIDVVFLLEAEEYDRAVGSSDHGAWSALAAAFSTYASAVVGANVEARFLHYDQRGWLGHCYDLVNGTEVTYS